MQISDVPVLQAEEGLVEIFTDLHRGQHRFAVQIFENPAISPTEMIKFFSQDRAQQHCFDEIIETAAISLNEEIEEVAKFKRERDHQGP